MTNAAPQPAELLNLHGVATEFALKYKFVEKTPPSEPGRFLEVLSSDRGESIASAIADRLWVVVNCTKVEDLADCMSWGGGDRLIVSGAFKALVEQFAAPKTEFFPVEIVLRALGFKDPHEPRQDGQRVSGYWLMNCWNRIDAIDLENAVGEDAIAKADKPPKRIVRWKHLAFKAPIDADLFGFVGHLPRMRFVSSAFRDAVEAAGLSADIFVRPTHIANR